MVGLIHGFGGVWAAPRIIRDDVLDALYGKASADVRTLLDHALKTYQAAAQTTNNIDAVGFAIAGLIPGPARHVHVDTASELLHVAALLYSSLAQIDKFDDQEENDSPQPEEINKRFSTEVREAVTARRPDLAYGFGKGGRLTEGGSLVRFGYFSPAVILHFSVLHHVRQSASVRDARAKLWELSRAAELSGITHAGLITAVPRADDPSIGSRQQAQIKMNQSEIEREADDARIRLYPVHNATEGAEKLIELAA
ncbi:hypothetical protein ACMHYO_16380 [Allopusillimonas ginsengisoli]|uniref:hypothetical protein n=1 Tax=Allopusillimonas ginsengisoli TaxID=453575 RepID=UPI0039C23912